MARVLAMIAVASVSLLAVAHSDPVSGRVLDGDTGQPIAGATVAPLEGKASAVTDAQGAYKVDAPIGYVGLDESWGDAFRSVAANVLSGGAVHTGYEFVAGEGVWHKTEGGTPLGVFYTTVVGLRVEKAGYKPFQSGAMAYDYCPRLKMGMWGARGGWAKVDDIVLYQADSATDSTTVATYAMLRSPTPEPKGAKPGQQVTFSVVFTPAPGDKAPPQPGGRLTIRCQLDDSDLKLKCPLADTGESPDKKAADLVYTGRFTVGEKAVAGWHTLYVIASGRLHDKRWAEEGYQTNQLAARDVLQVPLFVVEKEADAHAADFLFDAFVKARTDAEKLECLRQATEASPDYSLAWHYLGQALFAAGRYEEAIEPLRKSSAAKEWVFAAADAVDLAEALRLTGRNQEALAAARAAWKEPVARDWPCAETLVLLADYETPLPFYQDWKKWASKGKVEDTLVKAESFERICLGMPKVDALVAAKDAAGIADIANACCLVGHAAPAEELADKTLGIDPQCAVALNVKGGLAWDRKDYAAARDLYQKAVDADATNVAYRYSLANAYLQLGDPAQARAQFEECLKYKGVSKDMKARIKERLDALK